MIPMMVTLLFSNNYYNEQALKGANGAQRVSCHNDPDFMLLLFLFLAELWLSGRGLQDNLRSEGRTG